MASGTRIWAGRAVIGLASLVVASLIFGPILLRTISLPHSSARVATAEKGLHYLGRALDEYERTHGGIRPASLSTLREYIERQPVSDRKPPEGIWDVPYAYSRRGDGPVLLVYLRYRRGADVLLWLDDKGHVRAARAWLFPEWDLTALRE